MEPLRYIGEHLWIGNIGHFCIVTSMVTALTSLFSFYKDVKSGEDNNGWKKLGRNMFYVHAASNFVLIGLILYAMYHQMYEYKYVFDHVSPELPMRYILSAFWEGQEGSFMLWMFWHSVLGLIFLRAKYSSESFVMFSLLACQAILATMLLGWHIPWGEGTIKIGSNPTVLLRQTMEAPIFNNADYLSLIKGTGLNPLLQNYWMTIHPPTLFLGFALTIFPFGFALGGLIKNDHTTWWQDAYKWALASGGILGIGILMGSLWAFEALSFGGYWNWDPVENASFVPWITLIAGLHTYMVAKHTGHGLRSTYFYYIITFLLVLYSTFLTRSGVLGDSSVHSFTQMGLEWQLVIWVLLFALFGLGLWGFRYKSIPVPQEEEKNQSKEFWMFVGSLVLFFAALLIIISTSLPVFNAIANYFSPSYEGRVINDPIAHYNKTQIWIAVFIGILSSVAIFLRYKGVNWPIVRKQFFRTMVTWGVSSILLTLVFAYFIPLPSLSFYLLAFAGFFASLANGAHIVKVFRQKSKLAASGISHLGFGLMLLGLITSGYHAHYVSSNPFVFRGMFEDEDLEKYVQLIQGKPLMTQGYLMTYTHDTIIGREKKFAVKFQKVDSLLRVQEEFTLFPNAMYSNDFSKVAAFNPDTRHYWNKDIFCCVVALPLALQDAEEAKKLEDSLQFEKYSIYPGDSLKIGNSVFIADSLDFNPNQKDYLNHDHDTGLSLHYSIYSPDKDSVYIGETSLGLDGALLYKYPTAVEDLGWRIRLEDETMSAVFTEENKLSYREVNLKMGIPTVLDDYQITLIGFDKNVKQRHYTPKEGDVAIAAKLEIVHKKTGLKTLAEPVYVIQDNTPMSLKYYEGNEGLHIRFSNIDPKSEIFTFRIAQDKRADKIPVSFSVAQQVPRSDYIILEAKVFPGINLFWGGTILMMVGLLVALYNKKFRSNPLPTHEDRS